ncbi:MAG: hypothetical protein WC497_05380 [Patescibacteria group bacterium]
MYRSKKIDKKPRRRLAIDFDGVIHRYSKGFYDGSLYDIPVPDARRTLINLRKKWWLYVYTTRARDKKGRQAVERYLRKYGIPFDEVVGQKPIAFAYIDDRAITFTDWPSTVKKLTAMNQKYLKKLRSVEKS